MRFTIDGRVLASDVALVSVGIDYLDQTGFSTALRYQGEFRGHFDGHAIVGELRFRF